MDDMDKRLRTVKLSVAFFAPLWPILLVLVAIAPIPVATRVFAVLLMAASSVIAAWVGSLLTRWFFDPYLREHYEKEEKRRNSENTNH